MDGARPTRTVTRWLRMRAAVAAVVVLGVGRACAQSAGLPATQPTAGAAAKAVAAPGGGGDRSGASVEVIYSAGQLQINANGAGLNQILREIAKQSGMKITGGVADEKVYGKYGPALPTRVLEILLEGTGSNMMLREKAGDAPAELILTSRNGGATPSPSGGMYGSFQGGGGGQYSPGNTYTPGAPGGGRAGFGGGPPTAAPAPPPVYAAAPSVTTPEPDPPSATSDPPADGGGAASPNGVKSPQQIYMELQQMQQQQAKP